MTAIRAILRGEEFESRTLWERTKEKLILNPASDLRPFAAEEVARKRQGVK